MSAHECMWSGCARKVPSDRAMCGEHWRSLPTNIQREIRGAYVPGQTMETWSAAYRLAIARFQSWFVATFGGVVDKHDPGRWERLVNWVRTRDAARAERRATEPASSKPSHLRLVP